MKFKHIFTGEILELNPKTDATRIAECEADAMWTLLEAPLVAAPSVATKPQETKSE
jgi:hypothetical protein